jgi:RNA polymerase sigma-70 factor (ECF subfamily)
MDSESFRRLFNEHGPLVWSMIGRFGIPERDAPDLFMEIWEAVWQSFPSYQGRSKLSTWIGGIARKKCLDCIRRRPEDIPTDPDTIQRAFDRDPEDWPWLFSRRLTRSPRDGAMGREVRAILRQAIAGLQPQQRRIMALWMAGHSYKIIADVLNTVGTDPVDANHVGKQIFLAKELIRESLKRAGVRGPEDLLE